MSWNGSDQIPDNNPSECLWFDLKIAENQQHSFSLEEMQHFGYEEWTKITVTTVDGPRSWRQTWRNLELQ